MSSQVVPAQPGSGPVTPPVTGVAPPVQPTAPRSLRSLAIRGAAWTVVGYGASQVLRLGSNLILTRLLFPEAFGLMALVSVVLTGLQMFSDVGIGPSIIQNKRGEDPRFLNTAWTIQVFRGFALWIACSILAWPVALFYAEPQLLDLLPVAGLTAVIAGFNSPALALANRKLALGRLTLLELGTQIITLVVMVAWAWVWPTVWALLAGTLLGSVLKMAGTHVWLGGVRCRLEWDKEAFHSLITFGRWIFVTTILTFLGSQGDRLLLGKLLDVAFLGYFSIALMIRGTVYQVIQKVGTSVFFPVLSRIYRERPDEMDAKLAQVRLPQIVLGWTTWILLLIFGRQLIGILYDDRYLMVGEILVIAPLGSLLGILHVTYGSAILARGRSFIVAALQGLQVVLQLSSCYVGWVFGGALGAVWGLVVFNWLYYPISACFMWRMGLWQPRIDIPFVVLAAIILACKFVLDWA
ncbi:MAG: oligosaccharide flippase family protein [Phycisphaerales bacterium]|nr:oligosaccharide flippase family protein [Phycisphaerales bacterium]